MSKLFSAQGLSELGSGIAALFTAEGWSALASKVQQEHSVTGCKLNHQIGKDVVDVIGLALAVKGIAQTVSKFSMAGTVSQLSRAKDAVISFGKAAVRTSKNTYRVLGGTATILVESGKIAINAVSIGALRLVDDIIQPFSNGTSYAIALDGSGYYLRSPSGAILRAEELASDIDKSIVRMRAAGEEVLAVVSRTRALLLAKLGQAGYATLEEWIAANRASLAGTELDDLLKILEKRLDQSNTILEVLKDSQGRFSIVVKTDGITHDLITIQKNFQGKFLIQRYGRAYNPDANTTYVVRASDNRLVPNYDGTQYMDVQCQSVINQIKQSGGKGIRIKMNINSPDPDYAAADAIMKQYLPLYSRPGNYTWHHMDDLFVDSNGDLYCTMQLVQTPAHAAAGMRHSGARAQLTKFFQTAND